VKTFKISINISEEKVIETMFTNESWKSIIDSSIITQPYIKINPMIIIAYLINRLPDPN